MSSLFGLNAFPKPELAAVKAQDTVVLIAS